MNVYDYKGNFTSLNHRMVFCTFIHDIQYVNKHDVHKEMIMHDTNKHAAWKKDHFAANVSFYMWYPFIILIISDMPRIRKPEARM